MTSATEQVIRAYVEACNAGDLDRVLSVLHPDVEIHEADTLPGAVSATGLPAVRRYLERFGTHWSWFQWEMLELQSGGEHGLMDARLHLRGRESGIAVEREWHYVFTVREGKLLRQDGYDDRVTAEAVFRSMVA